MSTSNSSEAQKKDLEAEIADLERLLPMASVQAVTKLLSTALDKARSKLLDLEPRVKYEIANRSVVETWIDKPGSDTVAITLLFDKVKQDDILVEMTSTSLVIKIHNAKGIQGDSSDKKHNYIYTIPKLHKEIDDDKSTVIAKEAYVLVELRKIVNEKWTALAAAEAGRKRGRIENKND